MQKMEFQDFDQRTNKNTTSEGENICSHFPDHYHGAAVLFGVASGLRTKQQYGMADITVSKLNDDNVFCINGETFHEQDSQLHTPEK